MVKKITCERDMIEYDEECLKECMGHIDRLIKTCGRHSSVLTTNFKGKERVIRDIINLLVDEILDNKGDNDDR